MFIHKSSGYLGYTPQRCIRIIGACLVLHNICRSQNIPCCEDDYDDEDDDDDYRCDDTSQNDDGGARDQQPAAQGQRIRDQLVRERFP